MDTQKTSRAQRMAESYADALIRAGVLQQPTPQASPMQELQRKLANGETNWWAVCLGQKTSQDQ